MKEIDLSGCDECTECNGEGGFWVNWPEEEWESCESCHGTGIDSGDYNAAMWTANCEELEKEEVKRYPDEAKKM